MKRTPNAPAIAKLTTSLCIRIFGEKGPEYQQLVGSTVRSVTFGILGVALIQSAFAAIGFSDDYIKVVKKRNLGLTARASAMAPRNRPLRNWRRRSCSRCGARPATRACFTVR